MPRKAGYAGKCVGWGIKKLERLAVGDPCIVRLSENWVSLVVVLVSNNVGLTLQDMSLRGGGLTCALQRAAIDEVHNDAVRELL
jgi:hypothetical protein